MTKVKDLTPNQVKISNIGSHQFTISWLTEEKTTGAIIYGESREEVERQRGKIKVAEDQRGKDFFSRIHWVVIKNLLPEKNYYFVIKSGESVFFKKPEGSWAKEAGIADQQKTSSEIKGEKENSLFISGVIVDQNERPIKEALVFLKIPGRSFPLSTLSDKDGRWFLNLVNFYFLDLTQKVSPDSKTNLFFLHIQTEEGKERSAYFIPKLSNPLVIKIPTNE